MRRRSGVRAGLLLVLFLPMLFACSRGAEPTEAIPLETEPAPVRELARAWYGFLRIDEAEGYFSAVVGKRLDCTGELTEDRELILRIAVLDGEEYLGRVRLSAENECLGGELLDRALKPGGCEIVTDGESMTLTGSYGSKDGGSFGYSVMLRPWGEYWNGEGNTLPEGYFDWYLPLIRDAQPMPDTLWDGTDAD